MPKKNSNTKSLVTLELLTEFYLEMIKPDLSKIVKKVDRNSKQIMENRKKIEENSKDISDLKDDVQELKVKVDHLDDSIDGIKADLSDTVSRKEFTTLKRK